MKHSRLLIKCFFVLTLSLILTSTIFPQQLIQTFTQENISGGQSEFGYSVAGAGDVNGDGIPDIIIGAPNYNSGTGRVYIYYGGKTIHDTANVILTGNIAGDAFGWSVASAGDVNGDGYADVIVGTFSFNSVPGRAYIFYGGKHMNDTADVILNGEAPKDDFGSSVSGAGDVNKDGYADVIVGAWGSGRAYIFYGGKSMDNTADVILKNEFDFGYSVSGAGDVNGDGYADVIVGYDIYNNSTGRAYIYYGGSPMDTTADVILTGETINNNFGSSVSGAGDVNKDGYDDVIIGASGYNILTGRAYIYYGGKTMDNKADVILTGEATKNEFGISVSSAGDVNGDGYSDVIVGSQGYNSGVGRAYIYYGGNNMNDTADVILTGEGGSYVDFGSSVSGVGDVNNDGYADVIVGSSSSGGHAYLYYGGSNMDNKVDELLTGEGFNDYFGRSVSNAGDVNGDGYNDVIVGAWGYNNGTGRAYIYYGGPNMDNKPNVILNGESTGNFFGFSVSGAGDVNGDGYVDVIVGAQGYNSNAGRAYLYYGGSNMDNKPDVIFTGQANNLLGVSVSSAGDVNKDGYDDVIIGAPGYNSYTGRAYIYYGGKSMDNIADVTLTGEVQGEGFGVSVSGAGDVNKDGYADVIVGAPAYKSLTGRAYIYYGGANMDNTADVTMTGEAANNLFGWSVSGAGDVNGDGYADVIVGAYGYNSNTGRAYLYFGGNPMDSTADITFTGEAANNQFGFSVSGAGDVNKDGFADVIIGAPGNNSNKGKAYIYYGGSNMNNIADLTITGKDTGDSLGVSVSSAGDIGKDGYSDLIIGAEGYNNKNGSVYIYSDSAALTPVELATLSAPTKFTLEQNYPNPFNPTTTIRYDIPKAAPVTLKVYDILGNVVETLVDKVQAAGSYQVHFAIGSSQLASGVYLYKLQAGSFVQTKKMVLLK